MLKVLEIENIAVIEKAAVQFDTGLNVLTGETGAGKSIVVDAINAILGERTSRELVRHGAPQAVVRAFFEGVDPAVQAVIGNLGLEPEADGSLVLYRRISAEGKSSCKINGAPCTVTMLRTVGNALVNIHGQHDSQTLLDPEAHVRFVDMLAESDRTLTAYQTVFHQFLSVRRRLKALTADEEDKENKLDLLNYQIKELEDADIQIGETERLNARRTELSEAEAVRVALQDVAYTMGGDEEFSGVSGYLRALAAKTAPYSSLQSISEQLYALCDSTETCKDDAEQKLDALDADPEEQAQIEERLDQLYRLSLKYGATEQEMLGKLDEMRAQREEILFADRELETLSKSYDDLLLQVQAAAENLTGERKQVAAKLEKEVCRELAYLDMPGIRFVVDFGKGKLSSIGQDTVQFLISTNPGEPPKPLAKIASGGELSRIMLAIKTILAHKDTVGTLIFDEIDTGVSGRASQKIGLKLRAVAADTQVICVTHSAQIASLAGAHFLIQKQVKGERTYTHVQRLDFDGRARELARIMGGLEITPALLSTAEEMLRTAREG